MQLDRFRTRLGFAACGTAALTIAAVAPAVAQGSNSLNLIVAVPAAVTTGLGLFAILATAIAYQKNRSDKRQLRLALDQVSGLRAQVDEYEALLSTTGVVTVIWPERAEPRIIGPAVALLGNGARAETVRDFTSWLREPDAEDLRIRLVELRARGTGFDTAVNTRDGRIVAAVGWSLGAGVAIRFSPPPPVRNDIARAMAELGALVEKLPDPAALRDPDGRVVVANQAYAAHARGQTDAAKAAAATDYDLVEILVPNGTIALLRTKPQPKGLVPLDGLTHMRAVIDALSLPIAIFGPNRELVHSNSAYAELWHLDANWLKPGMDERAVLDRLRTTRMLPPEPDYQAWRDRHLESYRKTVPGPVDPWHLPDGRTIEVLVAPAGAKGGVIYMFEDITAQVKLRSAHQTQLHVQHSTINALNEGVAVFGTDGRLTLANKRLSEMWKVPLNLIEEHPHIDRIIAAIGIALPDDGPALWRDLKRGILDLSPRRTDTGGRLARADGIALDYAITRLPDGQTLITFVDVTESANYQSMLTQRNEALETADRMKDAFVQNVSYELRSPLTSIIGFAELLDSDTLGSLNDRQKAYTDYIRSASMTLGVLIDSILDLATVDAGIVELQPELHDVQALIEKAKAGLAAIFPVIDGEEPLEIEVDIPEPLPPLYADGARIVQVLYNLLSTAARFSEPGGTVRLRVVTRGGRMVFSVEDDGMQMNEEVLTALGEQNAATRHSVRQRGAGLGLSIVRSFVHLHGGTIKVEPNEPHGSRVVVSLPISAVNAAE